MFLSNKLKFLHKLFHNNLPSYFQTYWEHFTQSVVNYNLRSRMLHFPRICLLCHVYAESLFVYQLVKILNDFKNLIIIKLRERSHSFADISNYITQYLIYKYSDKKIVMSQPVLPVNEFDALAVLMIHDDKFVTLKM